MYAGKPRIYYINNVEGDVYRVEGEGFTRDTGEKRCIVKNLTDGKRWDIAAKDLEEIRLIDGNIRNVWERMPEGWYPKKETEEMPYAGYTNDPREEVRDGYNAYGQPVQNRLPEINRFNRGRAGFRGR
jgi:hypothetical protein